MLLQCEKGNVLLDTGFGIEEQYIEMIDFIFISHFHYDHTGGVIEILQKKDIQVIISSITLDYMLNIDSICEENKKRILKNAVIADSLKDLEHMNEKELLLGSKCYLTGPLALENTVYECIEDIHNSNIKRLASSDWSFHSNKESLDEFIMEHQKCDIVLFHSFLKILSKYKKSFSDNQSSRIHIVNKDEIIL